MASRAHRWPSGNTPLTGVHGGSAAAARLAIAESKRLKSEREVAAKAATRKDRLRPRRLLCGVLAYPPTRPPFVPPPTKPRPAGTLAEIIWNQCGGVCVYCRKPMLRMEDDPLSFSIDHVIPKCRGGSNRIANLVGAHKRCNNEKGSLTGDEYRLVLAQRGTVAQR